MNCTETSGASASDIDRNIHPVVQIMCKLRGRLMQWPCDFVVFDSDGRLRVDRCTGANSPFVSNFPIVPVIHPLRVSTCQVVNNLA